VNWNATMHVAGWICLLTILVVAIWSMYQVVRPQWRRILSLAAGNIEPACEPAPVVIIRGSEYIA
jgi:hypothetical protein